MVRSAQIRKARRGRLLIYNQCIAIDQRALIGVLPTAKQQQSDRMGWVLFRDTEIVSNMMII
jgi:hypothetical protein